MRAHLVAAVAAWAIAGAADARGRVMNAGELAHELDRLAHTGRVLYVAAHPDDENTRLLAYLANARHLQVAYLSMTRGGGGQNLLGSEQGELLDVIRTNELLAARRMDGAQQRFTLVRDFGFSKSAREALRTWVHEEALADVVHVIRTFQPDVIVTRFDEDPPNHGHHTASAILAREAFVAAADPARFPGQLVDGVKTWQAMRLVYNHAPWRRGPPPEDALSLDVGGYDPRLGLSYGELAALSRSEHKSQGFGVAGERGALIERFIHVAGRKAQDDILDNVVLDWTRFGEKAKSFSAALEHAREALDLDRPERAVPFLLEAHRALDALPDDVRVREARSSLERIIEACAGLFVRARAERPEAVPGSDVEVSLELVMRRPVDLSLTHLRFPGGDSEEPTTTLGLNQKREWKRTIHLAPEAPVSIPYWLREPATPGRYRSDVELIDSPRGPSALQVEIGLRMGDRSWRTSVPVVHSWVDRVHGERVRDFAVVPPATITPERTAVMVPAGRPGRLDLRVRAGRGGLRGQVHPNLPEGWVAKPSVHPVELSRAGDEEVVRFDVQPPAGAEPITASPFIEVDGARWSYRGDLIDYPHIQVERVIRPAAVRLVPLAVKLPKGLVGYVRGSGDTVAEDLAHIGVRVEAVKDETLLSGDLRRYAAIVIGIRAYNTRPVLHSAHPRLMRYVERGGTVVVQYNTRSRWSPLEVPVGPFPLEIGEERVTDETSTVRFLDPRHPLLRGPNALGPADFAGWVQERGLYFATSWDERYQPLFGMADPDEEALSGSTLVARHGKGRYVYTGLSFFRQLPAGVPGAYRLFANLISGR